MTLHKIEPIAGTVHGAFSRDLSPVITIEPGDTIRFRTLDAGWNMAPHSLENLDESPPKFSPKPEGHDGHALCGPVSIRGAMPGMTLAIQIGQVVPGPWGWTAVGGWPAEVNQRLGFTDEGTFLLWELDSQSMTGTNQHGQTIPLYPFMGVMGMPADEDGLQSTIPPRMTGGNIDCKELIEGSTLYLPIAVEGGLFSTGDGHGRQGDGESCVTAIECPIDSVDLTFVLHPDLHLTTPRACTPSGWLTFGFHKDLNEATYIALEAMIDLIVERYGLDRLHAFGLVSVMVDLHITQIVNQVKGVHAILSHEAIADLGLQKLADVTE